MSAEFTRGETQLLAYKPHIQQEVLMYHHKAFPSDSSCGTCKGRCCRACGYTNGYLGEAAFKEMEAKYGFDAASHGTFQKDYKDAKKGRGFQTDAGCALTVLERSRICLGFQCYGAGIAADGVTPLPRIFTEDERSAANALNDLLANGRNLS